MDIIKLPPGEMAGEDTDCIKIERTPDGRYSLITSALVACDNDEVDAGDSEAVISSGTYASCEEAEAAGLAWAASLCVERIYVETSAQN
jgi:hypothetical protein